MQLKVNEQTKIVQIWMTNDEKNDPRAQAKMKELCAQYKEKKYLVAVFYSGKNELYPSILDLLAYNKRKCAELAAQREPRAQTPRRTVGMDR
ncbi:MAG: hypothetical protein IJ968_09880 [Clostridia bacterium]|nr:hypothetical protein [Clostridia bacterium]